MTGPEVIVNDVYVDPRDSNHVLLATDRGGVMASNDGGASFTASNEGFQSARWRRCWWIAPTRQRMYAGVVNDKSFGGAFMTMDGGASGSRLVTVWKGETCLPCPRPRTAP